MKGLFLKDYYISIKYFKPIFFVSIFFIVLSTINNNSNYFLLFYPCLMSGMIPISIMAYEEKSKWSQYIYTLPLDKTQIVSEKYILSLIINSFIMILILISKMISMMISNSLNIQNLLSLIPIILSIGFIVPALSMPLIFKKGVEKGRIAYMIIIGFIAGISVVVMNILSDNRNIITNLQLPAYIIFLVIMLIYSFSWYLSIKFYSKKEI